MVGHTARDEGLDADAVIFIGSPGVGVDHADELGVPPEDVWSSTAENDIIRLGGPLVHGTDPADPDFGGQTFASDSGHEDWHGYSASAHSQYWDVGSSSLENMGLLDRCGAAPTLIKKGQAASYGRYAVAGLALLLTSLAGCAGTTSTGGAMNTLSQHQAIERLGHHVAGAAAALPGSPRLTLTYEEIGGDCSDPTDGGPENRVIVARSFSLEVAPRTTTGPISMPLGSGGPTMASGSSRTIAPMACTSG